MTTHQRRALGTLFLFLLECAGIGLIVGQLVGRLTPEFLLRLGLITASALLVVPGLYWLGCHTWLKRADSEHD